VHYYCVLSNNIAIVIQFNAHAHESLTVDMIACSHTSRQSGAVRGRSCECSAIFAHR